jgi:hypothetical protein
MFQTTRKRFWRVVPLTGLRMSTQRWKQAFQEEPSPVAAQG